MGFQLKEHLKDFTLHQQEHRQCTPRICANGGLTADSLRVTLLSKARVIPNNQLEWIIDPGLSKVAAGLQHNNASLTTFNHLIAHLQPQVISDLASPLQTARARIKGDQQTGVDHSVSASDGFATHFPWIVT